MRLVFVLISMLPGVSSETRVAKTMLSAEPPPPKASADFADLITSIAANEGLSSLILFGGLMILILVTLYFVARYNARRRSVKANLAESEDFGFKPDTEEERENADFSGFRPNYISTESAPGILIAEEDDEVRLFLTNTLRLNYRVVAVKDGLKAFRKSFETVPDLIITNSQMPGMDGVSLCHLLKVTMATSHIPVIILNTDKTLRMDEPVLADGCIRADFDAKSLLIEIRNFMQQRKHLYAGFRKQLLSGDVVDDFFSTELEFINRVNAILRTGYHRTGFGVNELSDGLSLSRLQLHRKIKVLTNKSPNDYIRHFRVEEAKRFLAMENTQVSEVASRTGFSNLSGFSKAFKEVTGLTPVEFSVHSRGIANPVRDQ